MEGARLIDSEIDSRPSGMGGRADALISGPPAALRSAEAPRATPAWLGWLVMLLVLWVLIGANYRGATTSASGLRGLDFRVYYKAAIRLNAGQPLYGSDLSEAGQVGNYIYTPLLAELLRPIARLPYETAIRVWFFITTGAILAAVWFYARAAGFTLAGALPVTLLLVMSLHFWPTTIEQGIGNINTIMLMCLCGMLLCAQKQNDWGIAIWIALAALLKTWMIGMVIYLLLRRAWRQAAFCAALTFGAAAVMFAILPAGQFGQFIASSRVMSVQPTMVSQSFFGVGSRHFATNLLVRPLLNSPVAFASFNALGAIIVGLGLIAMWHAGPRLDPYREQLRLALCCCAMLLTMPVSHQVYHLLDLALIWTILLPRRPIRHAYTAGLVVLAVYLMLTVGWPTVNPLPIKDRQGLSSLLTSMGLFLRLGLWAMGLTVLLAWSTDTRRSPVRAEPVIDPEQSLERMDVDYACQ